MCQVNTASFKIENGLALKVFNHLRIFLEDEQKSKCKVEMIPLQVAERPAVAWYQLQEDISPCCTQMRESSCEQIPE